MLLKDLQKLTLIFISPMLGNTVKREIITTRVIGGRQAYKVHGGRKEYILKLDSKTMVFDGWGIPHSIDGHTPRIFGDKEYRFITNSLQVLKQFVISNQINEHFTGYDSIVASEGEYKPFTNVF